MKTLNSIYDCSGLCKGDWFKVKGSEYEILFITNTYADLQRFNHSGSSQLCIRFSEREQFEKPIEYNNNSI